MIYKQKKKEFHSQSKLDHVIPIIPYLHATNRKVAFPVSGSIDMSWVVLTESLMTSLSSIRHVDDIGLLAADADRLLVLVCASTLNSSSSYKNESPR